ncbi:MBL fold metallo-hydrolase [Micromonospora humi]|uniref:Glyoxylase, beta-lactamase superfamily II n=1 Tax=Micromonospora humi TaxID=745366 RepID=A0A1C5H7Y0_9ACTN|nr:MBL fold metallo-hydrolase [Micromonospora humi]SCG42043.1 Glyoxylase, beta-lactamase superfamily II [Micromonospora humi]
MRVHHLNCGSMVAVEPVAGPGPGQPGGGDPTPLPAVCHCLLVETDTDGLVLVETGFGRADVEAPERTLDPNFLRWARPALDPAETAISQVVALGFAPADVRHVVLTHLHQDHTGGLSDFPHARVHISADELATAPDGGHYPAAHLAHRPDWVTYPSTGGEHWYDFAGVRRAAGLAADILLIPFAGHTPGHTAVAVRADGGWLVHAGDAYFHQNEIRPEPGPLPPAMDQLQAAVETDRGLRLANLDRLRRVLRDHPTEVRVVPAHDPWEFERYASGQA